QDDPIIEQLLHQRTADHGVGDVGAEELVEADHPRLVGELAGNHLQRILLTLELAQLLVHPLHEAVEVGAHLALDRQRIEEGVDQIGLATPHTAPEIEPLDRGAALAAKQPQQSHPARRPGGDDVVVEALQMPDGVFLRGIMEEIRTLEVRLIAFEGRHTGESRVKQGSLLYPPSPLLAISPGPAPSPPCAPPACRGRSGWSRGNAPY